MYDMQEILHRFEHEQPWLFYMKHPENIIDIQYFIDNNAWFTLIQSKCLSLLRDNCDFTEENICSVSCMLLLVFYITVISTCIHMLCVCSKKIIITLFAPIILISINILYMLIIIFAAISFLIIINKQI